jgi:hypothetical protein
LFVSQRLWVSQSNESLQIGDKVVDGPYQLVTSDLIAIQRKILAEACPAAAAPSITLSRCRIAPVGKSCSNIKASRPGRGHARDPSYGNVSVDLGTCCSARSWAHDDN